MLWFLKAVLIPDVGSYESTLSTCTRFRCRLPGKNLRKKEDCMLLRLGFSLRNNPQ